MGPCSLICLRKRKKSQTKRHYTPVVVIFSLYARLLIQTTTPVIPPTRISQKIKRKQNRRATPPGGGAPRAATPCVALRFTCALVGASCTSARRVAEEDKERGEGDLSVSSILLRLSFSFCPFFLSLPSPRCRMTVVVAVSGLYFFFGVFPLCV